LRVLSTNLWYGRGDPDALVDLIRRYEVDLLGAQELGAEQAEAISAELPYGELEPRDDATGVGIACRLPVQIDRLPMTFRDLFVARLDPADWPGLSAPLEFSTTHIAAPHVQPMPMGPWFRFKQVRELMRHLRASSADRQLLVGDFNATPAWPVYWHVAGHMSNAAAAVAKKRGESPRATWGPWSGSPRFLRIDHAFTRGLEAESFEVLPVPGADHSAILMEFSLR